jgi:uncharacterized protein (TIGR02646 family)
MIQLPHTDVTAQMLNGLAQYQQIVDDQASYADRVAKAKSEFSARNKKTNAVFREVRAALSRMCTATRRCCYCEDSMADEVEHIAPKDLYPEQVFDWQNYLYACGPCNSPKGSQYAVITVEGHLQSVSRAKGASVTEPAGGIHALINPRLENPQDFLWLDIVDTFTFVPTEDAGTLSEQRATYTCKVLALNNRDVLIEARRVAFDSYRARLVEYIHNRDNGTPAQDLEKLVSGMRAMTNPAVWLEMKRSRAARPDIERLFNRAPEALNW